MLWLLVVIPADHNHRKKCIYLSTDKLCEINSKFISNEYDIGTVYRLYQPKPDVVTSGKVVGFFRRCLRTFRNATAWKQCTVHWLVNTSDLRLRFEVFDLQPNCSILRQRCQVSWNSRNCYQPSSLSELLKCAPLVRLTPPRMMLFNL